jgi:phosphate-selective porin
MNRIIWKGGVMIALLCLPMAAWAGGADGLSDLLIEKGVITKDEVAQQKKDRWLAVEGRVQARYTDQQNDDPMDNVREFSIPQAILQASGVAFPNVLYKVEIKFSPDSATDGDGNVMGGLKVGFNDAKLTFNHFEPAPITVGHFKVPLSRQKITSSGNGQFVNPAEVVKEAQGEDMGLMVGGYEGKKRFEYAIGAFNGTKTANKNDNDGFLWVGRVAFQPLGEVQYSESNLEGDAMRLAVGASVQTNTFSKAGVDGDLLSPDDAETDSTKYGVDVAMKFLSRASLAAEYIHAKNDPDGAGAEKEASGYFVQGGYFVLPKLELTARHEAYDPDDTVDDTKDIRWTTLGANYFFAKHNWKLQANYVIKDEETDPTTGQDKDDNALLVQLQVKF